MKNTIAWFPKAFPDLDADCLAGLSVDLGYTGIELCVRPSYQVYSDTDLVHSLQHTVAKCASKGIKVVGIAADLNERVIQACGTVGISYIRVLLGLEKKQPVPQAVQNSLKRLEQFIPIAEKEQVIIGIQEHINTVAWNSLLLYQIIQRYQSPFVRGIWDAAQSALAGESVTFGLGFLLPYCCSVQCKNLRYDGTKPIIVEAQEGILSWTEFASELKKQTYHGNITVSHEYSDQLHVKEHLRHDAAYLKMIL